MNLGIRPNLFFRNRKSSMLWLNSHHGLLLNCNLFNFNINNRGTHTVDVIRSYGYNAAEYTVVTEDGYILTLTQIKTKSTKMPVLMMHGVIAASDQWVLKGPGQDLAFILADEGHDVWLGDQRGNQNSNRHTFLNTSQAEYWDFSFHESGLYDIPKFIETVLQHSHSKQLYYIGHSMGTTVFYVMCSLRPQYNRLIHSSVHISPVAFGLRKNLTPLMNLALSNTENLYGALKKRKVYDFLARNSAPQELIKEFCKNKALCQYIVSQVYGESSITNNTKLGYYLSKLLSGTSLKTLVHLSQIYKGKNFAQFDYGSKLNLEVYKNKLPPAYPLERVTSPVALFYSSEDVYIDDYSVGRLIHRLPNVILSTSIPKFNHIDVLYANSAPKLLYKKIVKLLNKP